MKIKTEYLINYLEKINVVSDAAIIEITNDGLKSKVKSAENIVAMYSTLKKDKFLEYEIVENEIAINNIQRLINLLKMFEVPIISISEDVLKVKEKGKEAIFLLGDIETTKSRTCFTEEINLDYTDGTTIELKREKIENIFNAASILNTDNFLISIKNNEFSITVNNQDIFKTTIEIGGKIDTEILIGDYFKKCIEKMDKFTLYIKANIPLTIQAEDVKYIIASIER